MLAIGFPGVGCRRHCLHKRFGKGLLYRLFQYFPETESVLAWNSQMTRFIHASNIAFPRLSEVSSCYKMFIYTPSATLLHATKCFSPTGTRGCSCSKHCGAAVGTTMSKTAARLWITGTRHFTFEYLKLRFLFQIRLRNRREQCFGIRMFWMFKKFSFWRSFNAFPMYITMISLEICLTTLKSWVMNIYVKPKLSWRSIKRFKIWAWMETSSADTGSSHTINFGFTESARQRQFAVCVRHPVQWG